MSKVFKTYHGNVERMDEYDCIHNLYATEEVVSEVTEPDNTETTDPEVTPTEEEEVVDE